MTNFHIKQRLRLILLQILTCARIHDHPPRNFKLYTQDYTHSILKHYTDDHISTFVKILRFDCDSFQTSVSTYLTYMVGRFCRWQSTIYGISRRRFGMWAMEWVGGRDNGRGLWVINEQWLGAGAEWKSSLHGTSQSIHDTPKQAVVSL